MIPFVAETESPAVGRASLSSLLRITGASRGWWIALAHDGSHLAIKLANKVLDGVVIDYSGSLSNVQAS